MYLSLKTILLLGAALVAAVPAPTTPDAQGLDVSGTGSSHPPAPDALPAGDVDEKVLEALKLLRDRWDNLHKNQTTTVAAQDEKALEGAKKIIETIFNNQTTTAAVQSKCKRKCLKKYGPILGIGCMKKCKD